MREKYFVLLEGSDRAILRTSVSAAVQKKKVLEKYNPGKKAHIFVVKKKIVYIITNKNRLISLFFLLL